MVLPASPPALDLPLNKSPSEDHHQELFPTRPNLDLSKVLTETRSPVTNELTSLRKVKTNQLIFELSKHIQLSSDDTETT